MTRSLGGIAAAVVLARGLGVLSAGAAEPQMPLPWSTFPAGPVVSDAQPFQCPSGTSGLKLKLRDPAGDTYGYFSLMGDRWIVVRYPRDAMGNPDHIWFGTSPAESPAAMNVSRDEPFDVARHGSPCTGWLLGAPDEER
jgi:hypothetical protein